MAVFVVASSFGELEADALRDGQAAHMLFLYIWHSCQLNVATSSYWFGVAPLANDGTSVLIRIISKEMMIEAGLRQSQEPYFFEIMHVQLGRRHALSTAWLRGIGLWSRKHLRAGRSNILAAQLISNRGE